MPQYVTLSAADMFPCMYCVCCAYTCPISSAAIQALTELRVSGQRFQKFLDTPEPPMPGRPAATNSLATTAGANCDLYDPGVVALPSLRASNGTYSGQHHPAAAPAPLALQPSVKIPPPGTVALTGADYDWRQPFGAYGGVQHSASGALDDRLSSEAQGLLLLVLVAPHYVACGWYCALVSCWVCAARWVRVRAACSRRS